MSSPNARRNQSFNSPKKSVRPSTAMSPKKSVVVKSQWSEMQIIQELNGQEIKTQDRDIEIERLQTTCLTLNNKVSIVDDLMGENTVLKKRLEESENIRGLQKEEIAEYERRRI